MRHLKETAFRIADATIRGSLFLAAFLLHKLLSFCLLSAIPSDWSHTQTFIQGLVSLTFLIVYVSLLYEIIAVLVPFLRPPRPVSNVDEDDKAHSERPARP